MASLDWMMPSSFTLSIIPYLTMLYSALHCIHCAHRYHEWSCVSLLYIHRTEASLEVSDESVNT